MHFPISVVITLLGALKLGSASSAASRYHAARGMYANAASPPASSATPGAGGGSFRASFTEYGLGDANHSPTTCNAGGACGFFNQPGYNAAVSPSLFGPGSYKGSGCGKCYRITPQAGPNGQPLAGASSIVVKANNLCPADSNPICNQVNWGDVNKYGALGHFDLCMDGGAAKAFFGNTGVGQATGMAQEVDCSQFTGSPDITS